jgi:hypothetical protein
MVPHSYSLLIKLVKNKENLLRECGLSKFT